MTALKKRKLKVNYRRPYVYDYQRAFMDCPQRFAVIEASTKVGKTASMIIWLFEQALQGSEGKNYWWVAPVYGQAKIAYERMKRQISRRDFFRANESELSLTLPNGAIIMFKSAEKPDNLYGEDVYAAVFDEASRARELAWFALRSTLTSTGGKCKFIANVRGRGWYYKLAQKAKNSGDPQYAYFKITCWDAVKAGRLTLEEVTQAQNDLPEHIFRELYEAEPSDDGGNPFGIKNLDAAKRKGLSKEQPVAYGIDLAKRQDFTVEIGLDKNNAVCHFERYQKDWSLTTETIRKLLDKPTGIDRTGVGDPIVEAIQKGRRDTEGFVFTMASKQLLIEDLAAGFHRGEITFPEGTVLEDELYSFEYTYTRTGIRYSAPEGLHDDCVMALALAYRQRRNRPATGPQQTNYAPGKPSAFGGSQRVRF